VRCIHSVAAVALLTWVLACRSAEPFGLSGAGQITVQGLEQTVQLIPAEPQSGQDVNIQSVVRNRSSDLVTVASRVCGLDVAGNLALVINGVRCAGYSQSAALAPGDSVTGSDLRVVSAPPGRYIVRVRQLVDPEAWVEVPVVVH
jgi:hypothetical protein